MTEGKCFGLNESYQKNERILSLYTRLQRGEVLHKAEEAHRFRH